MQKKLFLYLTLSDMIVTTFVFFLFSYAAIKFVIWARHNYRLMYSQYRLRVASMVVVMFTGIAIIIY